MNTIRKHFLTTTVLIIMMTLVMSLLMSPCGMENISAANGATNDVKAVDDDILFERSDGDRVVLTGGADEKTYGIFDKTCRPMAGKIGFRAKVEDEDTLSVTAYTLEKQLMNVSGNVIIVPLETVKDKSAHKIMGTGIKPGETVTVKVPGDGDFAVGYLTDNYRITGYAAKRGNRLLMYRLSDGGKGYENWAKLQKKIDKQQALTSQIHYQMEGMGKGVPKLADKIREDGRKVLAAKETELGRKLTDEEKLYVLIMDLRENYALDSWKINNQLDTRALADGDLTDRDNYTIFNKVGVCYDFASMIGIALRDQGVPTALAGNPSHSNLTAFLNGEWLIYDASESAIWRCIYEDTDPAKWDTAMDGIAYGAGNMARESSNCEITSFSYNFLDGNKL